MGRGLRRTVDLFHSARDLVEENERRVDLEEDDGGGGPQRRVCLYLYCIIPE